jgi:hypothetical protein
MVNRARKKYLSFAALLGVSIVSGCHETQHLSRESVVGSYVYKSQDPDGRSTDHELDHLILQADGKYYLVLGGSTKPKTEKVGNWRFYGGDSPEIDLDHAGYPVRVKGDEVRLLVDDDVGIWYAKVR